MEVSKTIRAYIGLATIVLTAIAIYGLYNVWSYILSPPPPKLSQYEFYIRIVIASTFLLALIFLIYRVYTRTKASMR